VSDTTASHFKFSEMFIDKHVLSIEVPRVQGSGTVKYTIDGTPVTPETWRDVLLLQRTSDLATIAGTVDEGGRVALALDAIADAWEIKGGDHGGDTLATAIVAQLARING
jgi:hypothetical protein